MNQHPRRRPIALAALTLAALLALGGCAPDNPGDEPTQSPDASTRPARSGMPAEPVPSESGSAALGEVPAELLARITAEAAERADVDPSALEVVRAESVTWSDGSLGCPEPGQLYTQALVPGYHVVLEADGTELDYRATEDGTFRLCENPGPPSGG